jgi:hypothetical protein
MIVAVSVSGCAPDPSDGAQAQRAPSTTTLGTAETPAPGSVTVTSSEQIDPGLTPYVDIAVADLAKRLAIAATEISVVSATLEVWKDSSLGCPKPGQQYAQVVTDGSRIELSVAGVAYVYHAGGSRPPFLCERPA